MELKNFELNLAKIRINKGMSAYKLSILLDKDETYINKIENGKSYPSVPMIFEIAKVLEVEPLHAI